MILCLLDNYFRFALILSLAWCLIQGAVISDLPALSGYFLASVIYCVVAACWFCWIVLHLSNVCVCGFDFGRFVLDRARPRALSTPSFWILSRRTAGGIRRSRSSGLFWMERRISTARCTPTARSSRSCCMSTRARLSTVSIRRGCARSLPARRALAS